MKYHNHKLQTNPWHCEEESHNNHETPGRQTKQSNQLSLPHQDDCMDIQADQSLFCAHTHFLVLSYCGPQYIQ